MTGFRIWLTLLVAAFFVALPIDSVPAQAPQTPAAHAELNGGQAAHHHEHARADLEEERDGEEERDASDGGDAKAHAHAVAYLSRDPGTCLRDGPDALAGHAPAWTLRVHSPRGPPLSGA